MGLVLCTALFKNKQVQKPRPMVLTEGAGFPGESGQYKGWEAQSTGAMKLQILDKIIFLALPNSFEMCNCSSELYVLIKYSYLQTRSRIFPSDIYFISLRKLGGANAVPPGSMGSFN